MLTVKKLLAFVLALVLALVTIVAPLLVFSLCAPSALRARVGSTFYARNYDCVDALSTCLNEGGDCIPVFGSSELGRFNEDCFPSALFRDGNSDFNMLLYGKGYYQSLSHAYTLAALADNADIDKAVLILSPQWFSLHGIESGAFADCFQLTMFIGMLKNDSLSPELKETMIQKTLSLLWGDPTMYQRVSDYADFLFYHTAPLLTRLRLTLYDGFLTLRTDLDFIRHVPKSDFDPTERVCAAEALSDMDALLDAAEQQGRESCTDNDLAIYNQYYDTYIRDSYDELAGQYAGQSYAISPEYNQLKIFLDVCREMDIEPLLVLIPVNGSWYDYCEFPAEDRQTYYQKIRDIAAEYGVALADFADQEYSDYFLRDIMHLGWKGWVYLDEAIYDFAH